MFRTAVCVGGCVWKCTSYTLCIIVHIIVIRSVRGVSCRLEVKHLFCKNQCKRIQIAFHSIHGVFGFGAGVSTGSVHPPHWIKLFLPEWNYKEWMNSNQSRMHCVGLTINPNKIYRITPFIVFCFHPTFSSNVFIMVTKFCLVYLHIVLDMCIFIARRLASSELLRARSWDWLFSFYVFHYLCVFFLFTWIDEKFWTNKKKCGRNPLFKCEMCNLWKERKSKQPSNTKRNNKFTIVNTITNKQQYCIFMYQVFNVQLKCSWASSVLWNFRIISFSYRHHYKFTWLIVLNSIFLEHLSNKYSI